MAEDDQARGHEPSVTAESNQKPDHIRRRLVMGAAAAPAVLTLYSGAARANASTYHCLVEPATATSTSPSKLFLVQSVDEPPPPELEDGWATIALRQDGTTVDGQHWGEGSDVDAVQQIIRVKFEYEDGLTVEKLYLARYSTGSGFWDQYWNGWTAGETDALSGLPTFVDPNGQTWTTDLDWNETFADEVDDTLIHVMLGCDLDGNICGVVDPGSTLSSSLVNTTNSCWASINGAQIV